MEGYKFMFDEKNIVTVWSCPNYCYNSGNVASVMLVDEALRYDFKIFKEVREPALKGYRMVRACACGRVGGLARHSVDTARYVYRLSRARGGGVAVAQVGGDSEANLMPSYFL